MRFSNGEVVVQADEFAKAVISRLRFLEEAGFLRLLEDQDIQLLWVKLTYRRERVAIVVNFEVREQWIRAYATPTWALQNPHPYELEGSHLTKYLCAGSLVTKAYRKYRRLATSEPGAVHSMPVEKHLSPAVLERFLDELIMSIDGPDASFMSGP